MSIVSVNKLSLLDYPEKISCIIYTSACNFRCPFCHNGLTLLDSKEEFPYEEIMDFLKSRKGKLDAVVITGGEPTLLSNLKQLIIDIKSLGYLVKLDTNGTNPDVVKDLIDNKLIDYVAMDIKNSLSMYSITCGVSSPNLENIKKTIKLLQNSHILYEFRTTLVKEFHTLDSIKELGELLKGSELLFLQQYKLSDGVINKNLHPVDEDLAYVFRTTLLKYINKVELRGY